MVMNARNQPISQFRGLWSLRDFMRVFAEHYLNIGTLIHDMTGHFGLVEGAKDDPGKLAGYNAEFKKDLGRLLRLCQQLKLTVAASLIEPRLVKLPSSENEYEVLIEAIYAELGNRVFIFVPPHRSDYYEKDSLLNPAAKSAFPKATAEMRKAGNAFAFGLTNAAVYHCMGALEHGLRALAADLGLVFDVQNWQNIIDEIEKKIKESGKAPGNDQAKKVRLQFLGEAAKEFTYFKDGWRNYSAHNKVDYDEPQALAVLNHVSAFVETLSKHLKE